MDMDTAPLSENPAPAPNYGSAAQSLSAPEQCLMSHSKIEVREKASLIEGLSALVGYEVEMANKYQIFGGDAETEIFYAVEQTGFCTRQMKGCAPDCVPWDLDILYTQGGQQQLAYKLTRDFSCTCCCFNRPVVQVTDVISGQKIGSIKDPWACCDLTFSLRDASDTDVLYAKGGCCQCGLCCPLPCGPCSTVEFNVKDAQTDEETGHVQKKVPSCFKFLFANDVDNYKVDFEGVRDPKQRALLMALSIFIDFRYFNDNSNDDNGGLAGGAAMGGITGLL